MQPSEKLAIAAHLHVLLRRKTGRVTDTEWMALNLEYAREIVRFSREKARVDAHPELAEWAGKLEKAMVDSAAAAAPHRPLAQSALQLLRERTTPAAAPAEPFTDAVPAASGFADSGIDPDRPRRPRPDAPRYVGGIR